MWDIFKLMLFVLFAVLGLVAIGCRMIAQAMDYLVDLLFDTHSSNVPHWSLPVALLVVITSGLTLFFKTLEDDAGDILGSLNI